MTRIVIGLLAVGLAIPVAAQTPTTPPSYYSQKTPPAGTSPNTQQVRRTAGEAPVSEQPPRTGGNVISQPPSTLPANGANPNPPTTRPNSGQTQPLQPLGPPAPNGAQQPQRPAMLPPGFPLAPQEERAVDQILQQWQMQSGQIKRFKCEFQCWEYDPVFGPKDKAKVFSKGQIAFESPDKGMFKENESRVYSAPKEKGAEAEYNKQPDEHLKHWVCDGKQVFEYDAKKKELVQRVLPPEMQGKAISDGPLPFLFGMDSAKMKARYWIRPVEKDGAKDAFALEAIPKRPSDAANYRQVHIVLDAKTFLPQYLELYPPNFDPKQNPAKATYQFLKVEKNWNEALAALNPWKENFFEPKTPSGWKKVVENFSEPAKTGPAGGPPGGRPVVAPAGATSPVGGQARNPVAPAGATKK